MSAQHSARATGGGRDATDEVAHRLGALARRDVPIGPRTTYRVGGQASLYVDAADGDDLVAAARAIAGTGVEVLVIGKGSNLLVADTGFPGLVIVLAGEQFSRVEIDQAGVVLAGGAASLPVLARVTAAAGLTGLEWAVGVPGSVGGALRMNAGGHGSDTSKVLIDCGLVDLAAGEKAEEVTRTAGQLEFAYRHSAVTASDVVVWARLRLAPGDAEASAEMIEEIVRWRREHQPGGHNAGSVFTNPPGDSAGRLIDAAGLRGYRRGSAQVSEKHANFIQADDGGSAGDVYALIQEVQRVVEDRTGIHLAVELKLVGFGPPEGQPSSIDRGLTS